jgi:hypothetical protein
MPPGGIYVFSKQSKSISHIRFELHQVVHCWSVMPETTMGITRNPHSSTYEVICWLTICFKILWAMYLIHTSLKLVARRNDFSALSESWQLWMSSNPRVILHIICITSNSDMMTMHTVVEIQVVCLSMDLTGGMEGLWNAGRRVTKCLCSTGRRCY